MSKRTLLKIVVFVLLAAAVVGIYLSPAREQLTRENVRLFVAHLRGVWYGPLVFMGAFMLACVLALPASVFVIAAGFIWGWFLGGVYSIVGGLLGAIASFYVGRFVGEGLLEKFGRIGRAVAKQVDHATFRSSPSPSSTTAPAWRACASATSSPPPSSASSRRCSSSPTAPTPSSTAP
jgi:uncharacterized membrane protein YdjX (TVP38/TMEM64 family)